MDLSVNNYIISLYFSITGCLVYFSSRLRLKGMKIYARHCNSDDDIGDLKCCDIAICTFNFYSLIGAIRCKVVRTGFNHNSSSQECVNCEILPIFV